MNKKTHLVLAFYHLFPLENPQEEVKIQKEFLSQKDAKCRIYIGPQGINGQLSASYQDACAYMDWLTQRPEYKEVTFKIHKHHENVFPRQTIKFRKELVAYDSPTDLSNKGEHLPPSEWKQMLQNKENILLDIRNDYEWKIGRFEGAELPPCKTFRDFRTYADELKQKVDPQKTPVMMYCTGGIRCELFSAVLKEKGFQKVYQLEGGVINYGLKQGNDHWLGKLFVFDDRLAVPISDEQCSTIGTCHHCGKANDTYYNCANMDCNELFLCCPECLSQFQGCCQGSCQSAKRLRPYHQCTHKPFQKWYHYLKEKNKEK